MRDDKENLIVKLTFEFALDIKEFSEMLEANKKVCNCQENYQIRYFNWRQCT